jgi:hypothetical protein
MSLYYQAAESKARERERESDVREYFVRRDDAVVCRLKNHFLSFFFSNDS